ncbi:MarR family winged helix-turn-helix transcriptional regulator [Streptomyces sp. bgisy100]|uniref:MarR family winged helix-turn-helix transcriptional regulator n=1 Tax=Streptomyces sp. bgisy100 TaxID=3413783 RepID=UPI003D761C30
MADAERPAQDLDDLARDLDDVDAVTQAVMTASRLLVAMSARSLAAVEDRLTLPQFRLLVVLATHGAAKLVVLAESLGVNPSTAMRMMDRLTAAGLADRQVNPSNRRESLLQLTEEGRTVVDQVMTRRRDEIARTIARMAPAQRVALVEALTAFTDAGDEPAVRDSGRDLYPLGWSVERG